MKKLPPAAGIVGYVLMGLAVIAASLGAFVWTGNLNIAIVLGASFVYMAGAFLAVAAFSYVKGSKTFLAIRVIRVAFMLLVMYSLLRSM